MKRLATALALSTLCLTSCAEAPRVAALTPDPARYTGCPAAFPAPPELPALAPFMLPDGRDVVLLETVIARETLTAHYILAGKGAWYDCRSPVAYTQDWIASVSAGKR